MALNASRKIRPAVLALQKRGIAVILERTETAYRTDANRETSGGVAVRRKVRISAVKRKALATTE